MDKLLSIIIPSYNMEKYLAKCLESVVVPDEKFFECLDVIVVNDGSKDGTSAIAHDFERRYPGVFRVIDKRNGNYGSCVNAALKVADGRFIKILDADDTYDTPVFAKYLEELSALPSNVDMVINDYVEVDEKGKDSKRITYSLSVYEYFAVSQLSWPKIDMAMHAVCFRTALLREIGYVQTEGISYTDTEWFYLPVAAAKVICYRKLPVYRYLVGRIGQTVEASTCVKNCWMMEKILLRMVADVEDKTYSPEANRYLVDQICRLVACISYVKFKDGTRTLLRSFFKFIHPIVLRHPYVKSALPRRELFSSTPIRFNYVEFLAEHPLLADPVLTVVNCYAYLRRVI